jgi:hypothetical protein
MHVWRTKRRVHMSGSIQIERSRRDRAMHPGNLFPLPRPETPFPRHWMYYIGLKLIVLALASAVVISLYPPS